MERNTERDQGAAALAGPDPEGAAQVARPAGHADEAVAAAEAGLRLVHAPAVIAHPQHERAALHRQVDLGRGAPGMAGEVAHRLLEDQEHLAAQVRVEVPVLVLARAAKAEADAARAQDLRGQGAHALGELPERVASWVDGPHDVA